MSAAPTSLASLFSPEDVLCAWPGADAPAAMRAMLEHLAPRHGLTDVDTILAVLIERERQGTTVVAEGLAIPHARLDGLDHLVMGVLTTPEGVHFVNGEGHSVHAMFLLLTPRNDPSLYLQALSALARTCSDQPVIERLSAAEDPGEVWRFFQDSGKDVKPFVRASDIMIADPPSLLESDTLERAIDAFMEHQSVQMPVVDKDGDMVGVVAARQLLKVCLPDYILWVDDVEPILRFEPFADILQHESQTWLTEIMTQEFAVAQADVPAMQVARQMARYNTSVAYIVSGKKLVGVVTLQHFLSKVLRE